MVNNKDLFVATLTHDLKNSIQAQLMSLNLLNKETFGRLNSEQKDFINMIIESANYTKEMLYSILTAYKYDNSIIKLNKISFEIKDLISNCENEIQASLMFKGLKLKTIIQSEQLYADLIQLRRVISNLLNNAIHYAFEDSEIVINIYEKHKNVVFEFQNLSNPIPEDIKSKLFEKYVSTMGTGLGLYYCKKVIEAHNGRIYLQCKNCMNKFVIEIPQNDKTENSVIFKE